MRSRSLAALLCGGLLALPAPAADPPKEVDGDKLAPGDFTGSLAAAPGTDGSFTLRVEDGRVQQNPEAVNAAQVNVADMARGQERVQRLQAELGRTRDLKRQQQLQAELADALNWIQIHAARAQDKAAIAAKTVKDYKNIDFHAAADVKVRTMNPPVRFDDKGDPKPYTQDELKALKGDDPNLPGYASTLGALKAGDTVQVTLNEPKPAKAGDKDKPAGADAPKGNVVTLIVVQAEPSGDNGKKK